MRSTGTRHVAGAVGPWLVAFALAALALAAVAASAAAAATPLPVSPGARDAAAVADARCPTFSWAGVPGAPGYQIVVFQVSSDPTAEPKLVTRASVPANAQSWTPPVGRCLERGERYAWSVAAIARGDAAADSDRLEWSSPFLFEVEAAPSTDELEQAVATIQRHLRTVGDTDRAAALSERGTSAEELGLTHSTLATTSAEREIHAGRPAARDLEPAIPLRAISDAPRNRATTAPRIASAVVTPDLGTASLSVSDQIHLAASSDVFKEGEVFLWDDDDAGNTALGRQALASVGATAATIAPALGRTALPATTITGPALGAYNTAVGTGALYANDYGFQNTAVGFEALRLSSLGVRNTATGNRALHNSVGDNNTANGADALRDNTDGGRNTATGQGALANNTTAGENTATGFQALYYNTTGVYNTAMGFRALYENVGGHSNTAVGREALKFNTDGFYNTAVGRSSLLANSTGDRNVAIGDKAGSANLVGNDNVFLGNETGVSNNSGQANIFIGKSAGSANVNGSTNILVGNVGVTTESGAIRIGTAGTHTATFVAGIRGATTAPADAISVLISSTGQLGTVSSSRTLKRDIQDLGVLADRLLELRPVAFRFRQHVEADPDTPLEFGLIAEEVAEVFPELVVFGQEGQPQTVKYHLLSSLLLGELQRQHAMNVETLRRLEALEARAERP